MKKLYKIFAIILSSFLLAAATKLFIQQFGFFSGGFGGISIIVGRVISELFGQSKQFESLFFSISYMVFNIPVFYIGLKYVGKKFTYYSMITALCYSFFVTIIPYETLSLIGLGDFSDMLVISILTGLLFGGGIVLAFRNGFSFGGFDILGFYLNKKKGKNIGTYMFIFNVFVFLLAGIIFKDIVSLIYTAIYLFILSLMVNVLYTRDKRIFLQIITTKYNELTSQIRNTSKHTSTLLDVKGTYKNKNLKQVNIVITKYDFNLIIKKIKEIDPNSFVIVQDVRMVIGKFYVKPLD